ncbi:hypothetical protein KUCAC02_019133 [Chaenocephalus aceratus]|uniref:Uncharacterized protein n=1 Tax=Chaenocephalus aceratus TaxID=36190 RepID=A0ACB9WB94_CHAAC|nr:hypothetical protein KUCAC02_019133 [Chaenocephalus aceratus]
MLGARDLLFITISQNVSFMGKTWWMLMLVLRLPAVLLAGFTLFSDEQETFVCNTIQPGCSNVCFDAVCSGVRLPSVALPPHVPLSSPCVVCNLRHA